MYRVPLPYLLMYSFNLFRRLPLLALQSGLPHLPPPPTILPSPSTQPRQQEIHRGEQLNQKKSLTLFSKVI